MCVCVWRVGWGDLLPLPVFMYELVFMACACANESGRVVHLHVQQFPVNLVVAAAWRSKLICKQRADTEQINSGPHDTNEEIHVAM